MLHRQPVIGLKYFALRKVIKEPHNLDWPSTSGVFNEPRSGDDPESEDYKSTILPVELPGLVETGGRRVFQRPRQFADAI